MTRRAWIAFAIVGLIWGLPYLLIKVAVEEGVAPAFIAWTRVVVATAVMLPIAWWTGALRGLRSRLPALTAFAFVEIVVPFPLIAAGDREALIDYLLREVGRLAAGGADFGLFASNTPHIVFDEVERQSPIPLISIVEETAIVAAAQGFRTVGLPGTRFTMERGFYPAVFARHGITVIVPRKTIETMSTTATSRNSSKDRFGTRLASSSETQPVERAAVLARKRNWLPIARKYKALVGAGARRQSRINVRQDAPRLEGNPDCLKARHHGHDFGAVLLG